MAKKSAKKVEKKVIGVQVSTEDLVTMRQSLLEAIEALDSILYDIDRFLGVTEKESL